MRNIKLIIEYDGKGFNGWQKQPDRLNIQGEIEKAIEEITGEKIDLIASGRTDAGVPVSYTHLTYKRKLRNYKKRVI